MASHGYSCTTYLVETLDTVAEGAAVPVRGLQVIIDVLVGVAALAIKL
jgi:hypothetical protein